MTRTAMAILLMIALLAALLVGSRALNRAHEIPGHSEIDPAVLQYKALVDRDFSSVESLVVTQTPKTCSEGRAPVCREQVQATRAATQSFLQDLANASAPPDLSGYNSGLNTGLTHLVRVLDAMVADLDSKDFDGYADRYQDLFFTKLNEVYPYRVAVHCWPKAAVHGFDANGYDVIVCAAVTPKEYLAKVNADWNSIRSSINSATNMCQTYTAQCRERTVESKGVAEQFKRDLDALQAPIQLLSFERELRQALDTLTAALDRRIAAIDAGDRGRWDEANSAVEQAKFSVIGRAVQEMVCWPKGVHPGNDTDSSAWPCNSA